MFSDKSSSDLLESIRKLQIELSYKPPEASQIETILSDALKAYSSSTDKLTREEFTLLIADCVGLLPVDKLQEFLKLLDKNNFSYENSKLIAQLVYMYFTKAKEFVSGFEEFFQIVYRGIIDKLFTDQEITINGFSITKYEAEDLIRELAGLTKQTPDEFMKIIPILFTPLSHPTVERLDLVFRDEELAKCANKFPDFVLRHTEYIINFPSKALIPIIQISDAKRIEALITGGILDNCSEEVVLEIIKTGKKCVINTDNLSKMFEKISTPNITKPVCKFFNKTRFTIKQRDDFDYDIYPAFFITHLEKPLDVIPEQVNHLIDTIEKPLKIRSILTPNFICPALIDLGFWLRLLKQISKLNEAQAHADAVSTVKCFINNHPELVTACVDLLKNAGEDFLAACYYVSIVATYRQDILSTDDLINYALSLKEQPPTEFWKIFNKPEKFISSVFFDTMKQGSLPYFMISSLPVFAYFTHTMAAFPQITVQPLTDQAKQELIVFLNKRHTKFEDFIGPNNLSESALSLVVAAQLFRICSTHHIQLPNINGINVNNILAFTAVDLWTYSFKSAGIAIQALGSQVFDGISALELLNNIDKNLDELGIACVSSILTATMNQLNTKVPIKIRPNNDFVRGITFYINLLFGTKKFDWPEELTKLMIRVIAVLSRYTNFNSAASFFNKSGLIVLEETLKWVNAGHELTEDMHYASIAFGKDILQEFAKIGDKDLLLTKLRIISHGQIETSLITFPEEDLKYSVKKAIEAKNEEDIKNIFSYLAAMKTSITEYYDESLPAEIKSDFIKEAKLEDIEKLGPAKVFDIFNSFTAISDNEIKKKLLKAFEKCFPNLYLFNLIGTFDLIPDCFCTSPEMLFTLPVQNSREDITPEQIAQCVDMFYAHEVNTIYIRRAEPLPMPKSTEFQRNLVEIMINSIKENKNPIILYLLKVLASKYPYIFYEINMSIYDIATAFLDIADGITNLLSGEKAENVIATTAFAYQTIAFLSYVAKFNDEFLDKMIDELPTLSPGKLITLLLLMRAQMKTPAQIITIGMLCKHNFPTIVSQILQRTDYTGKVKDLVNKSVVGLTVAYFHFICTLTPASAPVFDEIMNNMENPFQECSVGQLILYSHPFARGFVGILRDEFVIPVASQFEQFLAESQPKSLRHPDNKLLQKSKDTLNTLKGEEIKVPQGINTEAFLNLTRRQQSRVWHSMLPKPIAEITPRMRRELARWPSWVVAFLTKPPGMLLTPNHYIMLINCLNKLHELEQIEEEEEATPENVKLMLLMVGDFFELIVNSLIAPNPDSKYIRGMFHILTELARDETTAMTLVDMLAVQLPELSQTQLSVVLKAVYKMNVSEFFPVHLRDIFASPLIQAVCMPSMRSSDKILKAALRVLSILNDINDDCIPQLKILLNLALTLTSSESAICMRALAIANKSPVLIESVSPVISTTLDRAVASNDIKKWSPYIKEVLDKFPNIVQEKRPALLNLLRSILEHTKVKTDKVRFNVDGLMGKLFDALSPEKIQENAEKPVETQEVVKQDKPDLDRGLQIPPQIYNTDPDFWSVISQYKDLINELIKYMPVLLDTHLKFLMRFPQLLAFEQKVACFRNEVDKKRTNGMLRINVRREEILEDSFQQLAMIPPERMLGRIHVVFRGEDGYDAGGVMRDWFTALVHELFNPNYVLFTPSANGRSFQPNPVSSVNYGEHKQYFKFAGKIMARAIIEEQHLDAHLTTSMIKAILGAPVSLRDLEDVDEQLHNSLQWILENDIEDACLDLNFTISYDYLGKMTTVNLKPDGAKIAVDNKNKEEYVNLMVQSRLRGQIATQVNSFLEGFHSIIPQKDLSMFSPNELDLLICGIPEIDIDDLERNTEFIRPLTKDTPCVKFFFSAIRKWSREDLAKLLLFITGSSQVPIGGFATLKDTHAFTIQPGGEADRLPAAHTCMNTLDLPYYTSEEELNKKLVFAIQECNSFGFI